MRRSARTARWATGDETMTTHDDNQVVWPIPERAAFLATQRLFHSLQPETLTAIAGRMRVTPIADGEFVFVAGSPADAINLLASGRIKVIHETDEGREVILRLIQPGEIFGGAGVWGADGYPASAVALEPAVVLRLPAREVTDLAREHPEFALALVAELAARLREAETRIQELQTERVERRIARALLRLADKLGRKTARGIEIDLPLSRQDLAELAGTTLSTASRTLSAWQQQGLILAGRERVTILQPHALVALAEDFEPPPGAG